MFEILLVLAILLGMAKHGRRSGRRSFPLRPVRSTPAQALSTLAAVTAVTTGLTGVADGAYRLVSVDMIHSMVGLTAGEGPITVGYAHGDYSVTEIKEWMEATAAISTGNKIAQEQSGRLIRRVGEFVGTNSSLNDGMSMKTKLNWLIAIGDVVNLFAYNNSSGALTTGAIQNASGTLWIKDST